MNENRLHQFFWIPPALLLITASLAKAPRSLSFMYELANYGFRFSDALNLAIVLCLPALEAFLGTTLLFRRSPAAALGSFALLLLFTSATVLALPTGYLQRCGCFGSENIDPTAAIAKNAAALFLLLLGFAPLKRRIVGDNSWGAFGAAAGSAGNSLLIPPVYLLAAIPAVRSGKRTFRAYSLGLLLGLALHLAGFPPLASVAAASALFLFPANATPISKGGTALIALCLLAVSGYSLLNPPEPPPPAVSLRIGDPIPASLQSPELQARGDQDGVVFLFLSPDCDECRDWLPTAKKLAWNADLPPISGVIPSGALTPEEFRNRENLPFPVFALPAAEFHRATKRPPLPVLVRSEKIVHIFPEGAIPTENAFEKAWRNENP